MCQSQELLQYVLSHQIQEIEAFLATKVPKKKTLLITDPRCLEHAGFDKYHNVARRKVQKEEQPENAERLMVLIDSDHGVLTQNQDFLDDSYLVQTNAKPASLGDIYRVHDYNYLMKVQQLSSKLKLTG